MIHELNLIFLLTRSNNQLHRKIDFVLSYDIINDHQHRFCELNRSLKAVIYILQML